MSTPFELLLFSRRKIAAASGSSPTQQTLTKVRFRIIQQVFNSRRLVYRNRVETNRRNLVLSTIENAHKREQATQLIQKENLLTDLKQRKFVVDSDILLLPSYESIDLTEPKDFYRFGVRVQSAGPHGRPRVPEIRPNSIKSSIRDSNQIRAKSAVITSSLYTASLPNFNNQDLKSDDEIMSVSTSNVASRKSSNFRLKSAVSDSDSCQAPSELPNNNSESTISSASISSHRITWPVKLKVFSLQDEGEARQQFLTWRAEQRNSKTIEPLKTHFDREIEQKYLETLRRRKEIEAFVTPAVIEEHFIHDPVFAKRYRQLQSAIRSGRVPNYDPNDCEIHTTFNKSNIERTRTALITAKESQAKDHYRNQQLLNNTILTKRIENFLKHLAEFNEKQK